MTLGINPNPNNGILYRFLPMDRLSAMQTMLVSMMQKVGGLINYECNRAKHVFSFNPNVRRLHDLFQKYFPEGIFPEPQAIARLKARLAELSFAFEAAGHEFMGNEEILREMSLLHEAREPISVSPEVFRAILQKRQRDQETSFEAVLDYSVAVSGREESARVDEIVHRTEQSAVVSDKEAEILEQEAITLQESGRIEEAETKTTKALEKRTESDEIRRYAEETREDETAFRGGQVESESHPAIQGETELRGAAAQALKDARNVRELITEGAAGAIESGDMQQFVEDTAERLSNSFLERTSEGKHFVYMGKTGTSSVGVSGVVNVPGLEEHIPPEIKALLSEKDPKVIGRMAKANVIKKMGPIIMEFLGEETVQGLIREHQLALPGGGEGPVTLDPVALFEKWVGKSFERFEGVLNKQIPENLTAEIVYSLREDAREVFCGVRAETASQETEMGKLFDRIAGQGFEEVLERAVGESLVSIRALFTEKMDDVVQLATQFLPSSAHAALTSLGLIPNIENPFWVDVVKNPDETFTVKLFANGLSAEAFEEVKINEKKGIQVPLAFETVAEEEKRKSNEKIGIQVPLVFETVAAEKLTPEFFQLLVDYEYRPKYKEGVHSFSVEHVVHGLTQYLGAPKNADNVSEIMPHYVVEERGLLPLMYLYFFNHQERDISLFHAEHSFDLSLHAFVDYWKEFGTFDGLKKSRNLRGEMRAAIDHLSKEAILLHNDEVISNHKLQRIYATFWEIAREMHRAEEHQVKDRSGGVIIPPGMQDHLKALLLASGADPSYLEVLKEAFLAAAGDDCEEVFDAALNELLPELVTSKAVKEAQVLDWQDIFKIETVKKKIEYIKMKRLSILQLVKFYAKMMVILFSVYRVTLAAKTIAKTIEKYYPGLKEQLPFSPFYLGMAITLFGPQVFAKILPKDVYESVAAIYHLSMQVSWYVFNRLLMHGFKQVLKKILKEEDKNSIRTMAKQMQQEILRKGELGYEVASSQGNEDKVQLTSVRGPVFPAFAVREVTHLFEDMVPKPAAVKLKLEDCEETLDRWIEHAEVLRGQLFEEKECYDLIYLNEQIRNLPIPGACDPKEDIWALASPEIVELFGEADTLDEEAQRLEEEGLTFEAEHMFAEALQVKEEAEILVQERISVVIEKLHTLLVSLYKASQNTQKNPQHRTETVISFYSLYVIIDNLAKGSCNAGLTDPSHPANGEDLFHFTQKAGLKVTHKRSLQQLRDVCGYFDFELGERLAPEEVQRKFSSSHFNYAGTGKGLDGKAFSSKGTEITVTPYQQFFSVEHSYFSDLLKRPEIKARLKAHGVDHTATSREKQLMLFRDPPMIDAPLGGRAALEDNTSEYDPRKGILPREYYILRLAHFMCSSRALFDARLEEGFLLNDPIRRGLSIPKVEVQEVIPSSFFGRLKARASKVYHFATLGAFQAQLLRGNLAILAKQDERLEAIKDRTIGRIVHGVGVEHTVGGSQREQARYREETFGANRVDQTSVIEAVQTVDEMSLLTVAEKQILDMVQSYDKDRLFRALEIFSYGQDRLRHPEFRVLFDLLCQNLVALEAQAKERVEVGRYVGEFFGDTIDHFKRTGDLETALFMVKMGIELEGFFISHDPMIKDYFPDFAWEIRECIIPAYQELSEKQREINIGEAGRMSGIYLALTTLAVSYMNVDLTSPDLDTEARDRALADIGRFAFYQGKQHPDFMTQSLYREAKEVVFKWANQLRKYCDLESDSVGKELRDELLSQLFIDAGIDLGEGLENWEGNFPIYKDTVKGLKVNLALKTIYGHASVFLREKGEEELRRIFGKEDLGEWQSRGDNLFEYPALEIEIQWNPRQRRFVISKVVEEERATYCPLEEITINWGFSPFAFEATDLIFVTRSKIFVYRNGELIARFTRSANGQVVVKREHVINGEWHQAVDLSQQKHELTLLNWFVNLDDVEAYSQSQPPAVEGRPARNRLTYIKLKPLNLEFKIVEKEDGTLQAVSMSEGTRGYVLCKRQEDSRLYSYPHAIILRNEAGAEKVILKSLPFATVLLKFIVNNAAKTKTSPMIDELINTQATGRLDRDCIGMIEREVEGQNDIGAQLIRTIYTGGYRRVILDKTQYFTTNFDEDGELSSKDPNMMTYLAYYHFCSGDIETAKHYFDRLETFGNQYPFTEDALNYIDRLVLLLGYSPEPLAAELALRLAAIREKNYLVQMPTDSEEAPAEGGEAATESGRKLDRLQVFRLLVLQGKYVEYLEGLKFSGRQYLTPEDELFIFKTLTRTAREIFDAQRWGLDEGWQGLLGKFGGDLLGKFGGDYTSKVFMPPILIRRLLFLQAKYNESKKWKSLTDGFLFEALWYAKTNPHTKFLGETKRRGFFGQINSLVKEAVQSPLSKPQTIDYAAELSMPTYTLEDLPLTLSEMEPKLLLSEFVHYYGLATNQIPSEWKDNPEKETLFQRKRAVFIKNFSLLKGNFSPKYALIYDLLDRVSNGASSWSPSSFFGKFPTADQIRVELLAVRAGEAAVREAVQTLAIVEENELRQANDPCVQGGDSMVREVALKRAEQEIQRNIPDMRALAAEAALRERLEEIQDHQHYSNEIKCIKKFLKIGPEDTSSLLQRAEGYRVAKPLLWVTNGIQKGRRHFRVGDTGDFNNMMHNLVNKSRVMLGASIAGKPLTLGNAWGVTKKVGLLALSLGMPEKYLLGKILNPGAIMFQDRVGSSFFRVWRQVFGLKEESEALRKEPDKISGELAQVLGQRENLITTAMRELLDEYCIITTTENPGKTPLPLFNLEGLGDEAIKQGFEEFNTALAEYYRRDPGVVHTFALKEGRSVEEFIHAIRRLKQEVTTVLKKEQQMIVDFVNQEKITSDSEVERTLSRLEKTKFRNKPLTFNDVLQWFLTEDNTILLNRTETSKEHMPIIKEKVYLYLMTLSRFNILFEKVNSATIEDGIAPLASELLRERTYQVREDEPERLLKAKVAYEARTGKMLWEVQASHLDRIILQGSSNLMNVMIMGDGKSSAVIPGSDYVAADGRDSLVVNVWPKSVKGQSLDMMEQNALGVYGQGVNAFVVDRRRNWDSERLWALVKVFSGALKKRQQINVTQEDLQSLLLRFLDEGLDLDEKFRVEKGEYKKRIELYKEILLTLRTQGIGNIDEIHEAAREDKELNFPLGKRKTLKMEYAECLEEVLLQLVSTPEVAQYIMIKDREPKRLEASVFEEHVAPVIAAKLAALTRFQIPLKDREEIAAYLCGRSRTIPESATRHPQFKQIALMRGALMVIMPKTLERIIHKHFHKASLDTGVEYVKPSEGNVNTVNEADFLSPFETFCKTACLYLRDRLSDDQVIKMVQEYLKTKAESEAKKRGIAFELTDTARNFKEVLCPGVNLSDIREEVSGEIIEQLRKSDALTLAYVRNYIRAEIKYYPTILESNGQDLVNMFANIRTHTGTPEVELLPDGTRTIAREGILGQSLDTFETCTKEVRVFTKSDPEEVLETDVIQGFFNQSTSNMMFIDRGAVVNGLTTQEVATRIWKGIQEREIRSEIKGVVFYLNATAMILTEAGIRPLSESKIHPDEYVTYFDESHTYAADVRQKKTGEVVSLLTIGETTTFEKEADQAEYRDRGIESDGHSQIVSMTRHVRDKAIGEDRTPGIREVSTFLHTNGRTAKKKRKFFIDSQKLEGLVKQAVIQKALKAKGADETCKILRNFRELLVSTVSDNPNELFGLLRVSEDPKVVLKAIRDRLLKKLPGKGGFNSEEICQLKAKLAAVIEGDRFRLATEMYEAVADKILAKAESPEQRSVILQEFDPFLKMDITTTVSDFFDSEEAKGEQPLTIIQNRALQIIYNQHFTDVEYNGMVQALTAIAQRETPPLVEERVHAFQSTEGLSVEALESMGRTVQVQALAEAEDEEQEQEIDNVNQLAQSGLDDPYQVTPDTDISWSESLTPSELDQWFKLVEPKTYSFPYGKNWRGYSPPLFELRKGLKLASNNAVRDFADALPSSICCSWNMFKVFTSSFRSRIVEPFGPRQKPIFEFLIVQKGSMQTIILIDQKEAEFWRRKLKEERVGKRNGALFQHDVDDNPDVKFALVDNISGVIMATGRNKMTDANVNTDDVKQARAILKLASGYTNFSNAELKILETWMKCEGVDRVIDFFEPTAYREHKKEDFDRSNLQALFFKLKDRVREPEMIRV